MAFRRVRHARTVMLMVPACPESGFLERAALAGTGHWLNGTALQLRGIHAV
jgi:hypothetical protein